jgi:hypothetical protein
MLVPIAFLVLVLIAAIIGGFYVAKRRIVDDERPLDLRPDDRMPTARPDLTNPPIHQPEVTSHRTVPSHRPV